MSLKVIGVGWGRTGTLSLKAALEILGVGPCYHMTELLKNPEHVSYWQRALSGREVDWNTLFRGYRATVDFPACQYWMQIGDHFEDAKFILTVRDPDVWYESVKETIYSAKPSFHRRLRIMSQLPFSKRKRLMLDVFRYIEKSLWTRHFQQKFEDKDFAVGKYLDHIETVKRSISPDRLLVYDISAGWIPLCEFLAVEIPVNIKFPYLNKRDQFRELVTEFF